MFSPNRARISAFLVAALLILPIAITGCGGNSVDDSAPDTRLREEKITFVSYEEGFVGINTIRPNGTGRRLVLPEVHFVGAPTFSPDGTKIAFLSNREDCGGVGCHYGGNDPNYPMQIWLMNTDGTGLRQMTRSQNSAGSQLSFSRDGTRILYNTSEDGVNVLRAVTLRGGGNDVLVRGKGGDFSEASLSPDGTKVLFSNDQSSNVDIYVMNLDGSGPIRLTTSPMNDSSPSFSPDGSHIVFSRNGVDESGTLQNDIYVMNSDGTGQTRLTNNPDLELYPSFSPDGTRIVYASIGSSGPMGIFVMNADGSNQRPVPASSDHPDALRVPFSSLAQYGAWGLTPVQENQ